MLRGLENKLLPARTPLHGRGNERLVAARGRQRNDFRDAKLRSLFEAPLEAIEFYEGNEKLNPELAFAHGDGFDEREVDATLAALRERDALDAAKPNRAAVTQLIELPRLRAQDTAQGGRQPRREAPQ